MKVAITAIVISTFIFVALYQELSGFSDSMALYTAKSGG